MFYSLLIPINILVQSCNSPQLLTNKNEEINTNNPDNNTLQQVENNLWLQKFDRKKSDYREHYTT